MSGEIFRTNSLGRLSGWLWRWMDWRLCWAGHGRTLGCWCTLGAGRTRDLSRLSLRPGQLLAAWSPPASCPRSGSGYPVSTHAATSSKEGAETGQASGQQWLEVPRPATDPQCCSAAVVQGTDRGVAADLVTADCSSTPAAAAAGHKRPSWSWSCS